MKKVVKCIIICLIVIIPFKYKCFELTGMNSKNILIYNLDEEKIIYEKNIKTKEQIASLTKIMTSIVSIEKIDDLNKKITVSKQMLANIPSDASTADLKVGDTLSYEELLYASMLPSGADATQCLAISLYGSIEEFVNEMNSLANKIGMNSTFFKNTTGLDENGQYSSIEDLLLLIKYSLKNDEFYKIFTTKEYTTSNGIELESTINYYNKFLKYDLSYIQGSKTGFTDDAGLCLLTLSKINETNIITITLDAPYVYGNFKHLIDLNNIYRQVRNSFTNIDLIKKGEPIYSLETKYSKQKETSVVSKENITRFIELPYNTEDLEINHRDLIISGGSKKDSLVEEVKVYYKNELIDKINVYLEEDVKFSLIEFIRTNIIMISIPLVLILIILIIPKKKIKKHKRKNY